MGGSCSVAALFEAGVVEASRRITIRFRLRQVSASFGDKR